MSRPFYFNKSRRSSNSECDVKNSGNGNSKKQVTLSKFFTTKTEPSTTPSDSKFCSRTVELKTEVTSLSRKRPQPGGSSSTSEQQTKRSKTTDASEQASAELIPSSSSVGNHGTTKAVISLPPATVSDNTLRKLSSYMSTSVINGEPLKSKEAISLDLVKQKLSSNQKILSDNLGSQDSGTFCSANVSTESDEDEEAPQGASGGVLSRFAHRGSNSPSTSKPPSSTNSRRKIGETAKVKYTPLEQQFLDIKKNYQDTVLFIECGYKYRFFGDDAEIAAKELHIYCHPDHSFMTASVPVHRLHVHVRRLVSSGHKVGVVKQTETAALKAVGENKAGPFTRKLTALYTKATLIGEDVDPVLGSGADDNPACSNGTTSGSYLMAVYEPNVQERTGKPHKIAMVAVLPSTGDIMYDEFEDTQSRSELETRISHVGPVELLLPETMTPATEKIIRQTIALSKTAEDRVRLERLGDDIFKHDYAVQQLTSFFEHNNSTAKRISEVLSMPTSVVCCLSGLLKYLQDFNLQNVLKLTSQFEKFSLDVCHMKLSARTLQNLEIFTNDTDGKEKGSLFWLINHTSTRFGSRKLRQWLARPLLDVREINGRLDSVEYILAGGSPLLEKLKILLKKLPDLEKGLGTIFHKKCSTGEFLSVCRSLESVYSVTKCGSDGVEGELLKNTLCQLPDLLEGIYQWVSAVDDKAAREGNKTQLFINESDFPAIGQVKADIASVLQELRDHRKQVRLVLRSPALEFVSVSGAEFLVEVKNNNLKIVPSDWVKISSTKIVSRFQSPFIVSSLKRLAQLKEQLRITAEEAWKAFLLAFEDSYPRYKQAAQHLATLDCLFSLAQLARQDGFVRPTFVEDQQIRVVQGRHPVVSALLGEQQQFVPNDTNLKASEQRCMIVTGPNMGGKSSYIKQVGLLVIMAQIGSFLPAQSANLSIVDAVYTRMGAADELFKGRSTFMVELQEASDIMASASPRSLVILDELGRGTSTHDGVAIAIATLQYFVEKVRCLTLFVTHYPPLTEIADKNPESVGNYHMAFMVNDEAESSGYDVITFLYSLTHGKAESSYGLNVARLADIPSVILQVAAQKSKQLESQVAERRKRLTDFRKFFCSELQIKNVIEELKCCSPRNDS